jgi:hypothetical protein
MVISRKLIKPLQPPLEMNSQILQQGTNHKHLGLFFSNNGLLHDHIDYIAPFNPNPSGYIMTGDLIIIYKGSSSMDLILESHNFK